MFGRTRRICVDLQHVAVLDDRRSNYDRRVAFKMATRDRDGIRLAYSRPTRAALPLTNIILCLPGVSCRCSIIRPCQFEAQNDFVIYVHDVRPSMLLDLRTLLAFVRTVSNPRPSIRLQRTMTEVTLESAYCWLTNMMLLSSAMF